VDRLFLDANILFSAAYASGAGLQRIWKLPGAKLCTSNYAVREARRNLSQPSQRGRLTRLLRSVDLVADPPEQSLPEGISLPEKDAPILLADIAAEATHLLTGDVKHFGRYFGRIVQGVLIVRPAEYLTSVEESS
jgi:predicted nucleic acid-binding protein